MPSPRGSQPIAVAAAIQGQTLMHCHAGCDIREVLEALNITMSDLFDEPKGATYRYDDGRIVHRSADKRFSQSGETKGRARYTACPRSSRPSKTAKRSS
jgi:hypothetical protein